MPSSRSGASRAVPLLGLLVVASVSGSLSALCLAPTWFAAVLLYALTMVLLSAGLLAAGCWQPRERSLDGLGA